jgi:hypothetical protein
MWGLAHHKVDHSQCTLVMVQSSAELLLLVSGVASPALLQLHTA